MWEENGDLEMKCSVFSATVVVILMSLQPSLCFADNVSDLESKIETIMNNHKRNQPFDGLTDQELKAVEPNHVLGVLERYEDDEAWVARRLTYWYEYRLAQLQPQPKLRQKIVKKFIKASVTNSVKQTNQWLLTFHADDFNEDSKQIIRQALKKDKVNRWHVLICGVARMEDQLPILEKLLIDEMKHQAKVEKREAGITWYYTAGWAARLARARMGVKSDIERCLQLVETVQDLHRRVTTLLHNVGYIRQPEAIEFLKGYLESDKRLPSVTPPVPGTLVASYVMNILIDCLRDFPIERKPWGAYSLKQIEEARQWMRQQKKWNIIR